MSSQTSSSEMGKGVIDMDQHVVPSASAPSYDEAMKCSSIPPGQMSPYPNIAQMKSADMVSPMPMQMAVPMAVPMVMPAPPPPLPTQQMPPTFMQTINVGGQTAVCPSCSMPLHSRVDYKSTCSTHCAFLLCCIFGFFLCAPFVYCTKCCREPRLKCKHCGSHI